MSLEYKPVTVETARTIAESFDKSIVIIAAYDSVHGMLHITTYGTDPTAKEAAAKGGEIVNKALGGVREASVDFEDYRLKQAQNLLSALKSFMQQVTDGNLVPIRPKTCVSSEFVSRKQVVNKALKDAKNTIKAAEEFIKLP